MRRGEVWWADLDSPQGRRPLLLLSRDEAYTIRSMVTVAPVTTRIRQIPAGVSLGPQDGLPRVCVANLDSIMTVPVSAIQRRITRLSPQKLDAVDTAIHFALGLQH